MVDSAGIEEVKNTKKRSAAYPAIGLQEAIEAAEELRRNLGTGPYSRESAAIALGYSGVSGASSVKIAALVHFGLLTRASNTYSQSDIADRIIKFHSEDERKNAIIEALQSPKLYKQLLDSFNGTSLPGMLENVLSRQYDIQEKVAPGVAKDFRSSAEFANVLKNGVINTQPSGVNREKSDEDNNSNENGAKGPQDEITDDDGQLKADQVSKRDRIDWSLGGERMVTLLLPSDLTQDEAITIATLVNLRAGKVGNGDAKKDS